MIFNISLLWLRRISTSKIVFRKMSSTRIKVNQGIVRGCEEKLPNGGKFLRFSGIPFAKPPINELRFRPPQKLLKFDEDEIDCTKERDACFHKSTLTRKYVGSEDCLNLNVYVPVQEDRTEKLAVMVYIHGGAMKWDSNTKQL
jgi:carboxylesterase type B